MTTTLRTWFDSFTQATGEVPTEIVFGSDSWYMSRASCEEVERFHMLAKTADKVQRFADLSDATLDKEFDDGYGGNESPNLCAWSEHWVIFNDNYDGSESLQWVPRHPVDHRPIRPGGG